MPSCGCVGSCTCTWTSDGVVLFADGQGGYLPAAGTRVGRRNTVVTGKGTDSNPYQISFIDSLEYRPDAVEFRQVGVTNVVGKVDLDIYYATPPPDANVAAILPSSSSPSQTLYDHTLYMVYGASVGFTPVADNDIDPHIRIYVVGPGGVQIVGSSDSSPRQPTAPLAQVLTCVGFLADPALPDAIAGGGCGPVKTID